MINPSLLLLGWKIHLIIAANKKRWIPIQRSDCWLICSTVFYFKKKIQIKLCTQPKLEKITLKR